MNLEINVDESILSNMGEGNLSGLLNNTPYQQASQDAVNPGVNLDNAGEPGAGQGGYQPGNVAAPANVVAQPGVTTGPGPQVPQAEIDKLRQIAFEASTAKIEAEEARFEAELAAEGYSDGEKEYLRTKRRLEQTEAVNGWLNNKVQAQEMGQKQQANLIAKNQRAYLTAREFGLPLNNVVRDALMAANDPQHMRTLAQGIAQLAGGAQAAQARNQLNGGVFAAGGTGAGSAGPNMRQHERSGDLTPLIENRGYTTVNW
jgi:hypothetical protein